MNTFWWWWTAALAVVWILSFLHTLRGPISGLGPMIGFFAMTYGSIPIIYTVGTQFGLPGVVAAGLPAAGLASLPLGIALERQRANTSFTLAREEAADRDHRLSQVPPSGHWKVHEIKKGKLEFCNNYSCEQKHYFYKPFKPVMINENNEQIQY